MNDKSPHTSTHKQVIDKILNRLAEAEQPLPSSLEFYRRILTIQNKVSLPDLSEITTDLSKNSGERLSQGKPILTFSDLKINWDNFQKLFNELMELSMKFLAPDREETEEVKKIGSDLNSLQEATKTWFGSKTVSRKSNAKNNDIKTSCIEHSASYFLSFAHHIYRQTVTPGTTRSLV